MIEIFAPVKSQNPLHLLESEDSLFEEVMRAHNGLSYAEIKEDGYRLQIHKKGDVVRAFTRQLNEVDLRLFPELKGSLGNLPNCILDSELCSPSLVGHTGFKSVKKRFRSRQPSGGIETYLSSGVVDNEPMSLKVFDSLQWEGSDLLDLPLSERRLYTENILEGSIFPSVKNDIRSSDDLESSFNGLVDSNYEGLVCKNPDSIYRPGKRNMDWVKLKKSESLDLVILGVHINKDGLYNVLCGTYNEDTGLYETLARVGAKKNRADLELMTYLEPSFQEEIPGNVLVTEEMFKKGKNPSYFVKPEESLVVEISAMNVQRGKNYFSCGLEEKTAYSLRISTLKDIRHDKPLSDIARSSYIKELYEIENS